MIDLSHLANYLETSMGVQVGIANRLFQQGQSYEEEADLIEVCYSRLVPAKENEILLSSASEIDNQCVMFVDVVYVAKMFTNNVFTYHEALQKLWYYLHAYKPSQFVSTDQNFRSFTAIAGDFITDNGRIMTKLIFGFTFDNLLNFNP
jgi:hypothetical protein